MDDKCASAAEQSRTSSWIKTFRGPQIFLNRDSHTSECFIVKFSAVGREFDDNLKSSLFYPNHGTRDVDTSIEEM